MSLDKDLNRWSLSTIPELAEIETVRLNIVEQLKNKKIVKIMLDDKDNYPFAFAIPKEVKKALWGARLLGGLDACG